VTRALLRLTRRHAAIASRAGGPVAGHRMQTNNFLVAKRLLGRVRPDGAQPAGLLLELYKALREAEERGFERGLRLVEQAKLPANDNAESGRLRR
jgi:hypothetical protein